MARVIKKGRKAKEKPIQWVCSGCDATIESKESEGKRVYDNREGDAIVTKCPDCGHENWISVSMFPTEL